MCACTLRGRWGNASKEVGLKHLSHYFIVDMAKESLFFQITWGSFPELTATHQPLINFTHSSCPHWFSNIVKCDWGVHRVLWPFPSLCYRTKNAKRFLQLHIFWLLRCSSWWHLSMGLRLFSCLSLSEKIYRGKICGTTTKKDHSKLDWRVMICHDLCFIFSKVNFQDEEFIKIYADFSSFCCKHWAQCHCLWLHLNWCWKEGNRSCCSLRGACAQEE